MRYKIVLQSFNDFIVGQEEKERIEKLWRDKDVDNITFNKNTFKKSMIKGIFKIDEEIQNNQQIFEIDQKFAEECSRMAKLPIDEKINKELTVRIFPSAFLDKGWIEHTQELEDKIRERVKLYFTKYPQMPRCPAKIWWELLKGSLEKNTWTERFYNYVARNDNEIYRWIRPEKAVNLYSDLFPAEKTENSTYENAKEIFHG